MVFAGVGDGAYNVVYLLHIIAVVLGTGAAFLAPVLAVKARQEHAPSDWADRALGNVMAPSLLAAGVFGGALVGFSDDVYDFGQAWLSIGGLIWIIATAAAALAYPPTFVGLPDMRDRKPMLNGILHLSLAVMLVLMTWKFGV